MNRKARCVLGVNFGMLLGLAYGVVSLWINSVFLPGIPLFEPPPGRFATFLIEALSGGALGFLVTWPEEFLLGVLLSSVAGTLFSSLIALQTENPGNIFGASLVLFLTFLPRVFFFLPVVFMVRWVVNIWEEETLYAGYSLQRRLRSVLLLVVICMAAGILSLYPTETRKSLKNLNELILVGRQASSLSSLPQSLQTVNGFMQYSNSSYSLKLVSDPNDIPIPRATTGFNKDETGIEVFFDNGFHFGCVYSPANDQPNCVDY
jgi:hypothetical protein